MPAVGVSYYCFVRVAETFVAEKSLAIGTKSFALAKFFAELSAGYARYFSVGSSHNAGQGGRSLAPTKPQPVP